MHSAAINNFDEFLACDMTKKFDFFSERKRTWESKIGKGVVNEIMVRPGLTIIMEDFDFNSPVNAVMSVSHSPIEVLYCVSGEMHGALSNIDGSFKLDSGNASFFFTPDIETKATISSEEPLKLITLRFDPEKLCPCFCGLSDIFPYGRNEFCKNIINHSKINSEMKQIISRIENCRYNDGFKKVYLESKAMELITLFFADIHESSRYHVKTEALFSEDEIKRIMDARDFLVEDMENPPTLGGIAKKVGMNKDKLNQGFHKVFGSSVFSVLRNMKMEKAKDILETGNMNVTETAYALGYSQPGTFSRAFKEFHGINPKQYVLKSRCYKI